MSPADVAWQIVGLVGALIVLVLLLMVLVLVIKEGVKAVLKREPKAPHLRAVDKDR